MLKELVTNGLTKINSRQWRYRWRLWIPDRWLVVFVASNVGLLALVVYMVANYAPK